MKKIISNLNPFNNATDMPMVQYIIKKVLAFVLIYCVSALIGEGVVIGMLYGMGYDPLHGVMPEGLLAGLLPYYGMAIFILVTFIYCILIEKRNPKSIGFTRKVPDYLLGTLIAVILLIIIIGAGCAIGSIEYVGVNSDANIKNIILWALAFLIQGAMEEIMCRGFLLSSLQKKVNKPLAVVISSTAFVFPHLLTLIEASFPYPIIGIINLYLISFIFAELVISRSNIWIACGLHSVWNFVLYTIMGLTLSGSEGTLGNVINFEVKKANVFNGGEYGIEASVITTVVLGAFLLILLAKSKGRKNENGVQ